MHIARRMLVAQFLTMRRLFLLSSECFAFFFAWFVFLVFMIFFFPFLLPRLWSLVWWRLCVLIVISVQRRGTCGFLSVAWRVGPSARQEGWSAQLCFFLFFFAPLRCGVFFSVALARSQAHLFSSAPSLHPHRSALHSHRKT